MSEEKKFLGVNLDHFKVLEAQSNWYNDCQK